MTRPAERLHRFDRLERYVHWSVGVLGIVCILSAAILYNGSLAVLVGNRHIVELVHIWGGFLLPIPIVVGLTSRGYRRDLSLLNRFAADDWKWLRDRGRRRAAQGVGKFNAGQKLNASLSAGSIIVFLLTGTIMYFTSWTPLSWRTGATFVHDWFALAFGILVIGHIWYAWKDPEAMRGMVSGSVRRDWADDEHPEW